MDHKQHHKHQANLPLPRLYRYSISSFLIRIKERSFYQQYQSIQISFSLIGRSKFPDKQVLSFHRYQDFSNLLAGHRQWRKESF